MGEQSRRKKRQRQHAGQTSRAAKETTNHATTYHQASLLAERGDIPGAQQIYQQLAHGNLPSTLASLVENDLGTLDALTGELSTAREHFERALTLDPACGPARQNLDLLAANSASTLPEPTIATPAVPAAIPSAQDRVRVAIISLLFNWPSTGGGTVHTAEAGTFLSRAGYNVRHIYAKYAGWGVGNVTQPLEIPSQPLAFGEADWNAREIQRRFHEAVDRFAPDYIIITDSWNSKPLLAAAVQGYRYFLRLAAQECLCPLNNVRLLVDEQGRPSACSRHQLATAGACHTCVAQRQHQSGSLHQAERELSGYGTRAYDDQLRRAFAEAEGVLVVNPLIAAAVSPHSKAVHVVPSGFDPARFPWPWPADASREPYGKKRIFFAGLVGEYMKGFRVLHTACAKLWEHRRDFEIIATSDPVGQVDEMTRFIGWQPQSELPRQIRQSDFLVFPTIAEEALGRSAVEAMGVGRPVIASRIGGLSFTVTDGLTGLLFEPGNALDLADKIETLLDNPALRVRMGSAGRQRFQNEFTWDVIIDKHYRRLLATVHKQLI
jgi:glycosyltransferase involved in cell wall biosynthesis